MIRKKPNLPNDYTIRRKRIYKGRYAPKGSLFLELVVKKDGVKYTAVRHVPGGLGLEKEQQILTVLYLQILREHFPAEYMKLNPKIKQAMGGTKKNINQARGILAKLWAWVRAKFKRK